MIAFIEGVIADITENTVVLDCYGVGYELFVPQSVYRSLPPVGEKKKLYTFLQMKEDGVALFGFANKDDLTVFKLLITVSGIGPKGAIGILSTMTADELRFAILAGDAKTISKAPGIGAKTAGKVILDLKDKFHLEDRFEQGVSHTTEQINSDLGTQREAIEALVALGYNATDALRAVKQIVITEGMTVEEILKQSLKGIRR